MLHLLMYHRVGEGKYANPLETFETQFHYLKSHAAIVTPGDPLSEKLNVCLSFDDATVDFYEKIYPLLQKYQFKAMLAIPAGLIGSENHCSWAQLREMDQSGLVIPASHSYSHCNLLLPHTDLQKEFVHSKHLLEDQLGSPITTFVYPYGKWNQKIQQELLNHYSYGMRIGSALNAKWSSLLYRIPSDQLLHPLSPFSPKNYRKYRFNYYLNRLRKR